MREGWVCETVWEGGRRVGGLKEASSRQSSLQIASRGLIPLPATQVTQGLPRLPQPSRNTRSTTAALALPTSCPVTAGIPNRSRRACPWPLGQREHSSSCAPISLSSRERYISIFCPEVVRPAQAYAYESTSDSRISLMMAVELCPWSSEAHRPHRSVNSVSRESTIECRAARKQRTEGGLDDRDLGGRRVDTGEGAPVVDDETGSQHIRTSVDGTGLSRGGRDQPSAIGRQAHMDEAAGR